MPQVKPRKPPMSERNSTMWVDKDLRFMREHSLTYAKPAWIATHTKGFIVALIACFILFIIEMFINNAPLQLTLVALFTVLFTLLIVDYFITHMRKNKLYKNLLERGGEIADPWNATIIKRSRIPAYIFAISLAFLCYLCLGFVLFIFFTDQHIEFSSLLLVISCINLINILNTSFYEDSPNIFMGVDEGMYFSGALFTYDVLSGIRPTGKKNGFELSFEGKIVATGKMLPDDMNHLQDMIDIYGKYENTIKPIEQTMAAERCEPIV